MAKAKVPTKYTRGLKASTASKRKTEIRKRLEGKRTGSAKYKPLPGDKKAKTRPSRYTLSMGKMRAEIRETASKMKGKQDDRFISAVAKVTKIPRAIIDKVFRKGQAAWATGHRPGATQSQWARARVYSFLQKGRTVSSGADEDLYAQAKKALDQKGSGIRLR